MNLYKLSYIVLLSWLIPATVKALPFEVGGTLGMENFNWQEFEQSGQRTEKETGARQTLRAFLHSKPEPKSLPLFVYGAEVKIFGGETDYSAAGSANTDLESSWGGISIEGEAGLRLGGMPFAWDFVARPGLHMWVRTLDENLDHTTRAVQAKEEDYVVYSLGLGTGPAWRSGNWYGRVVAGVKYAAATVLISDDNSDVYNDDVEIDIDGKTTGFITLSNNIRVTDKMNISIDGYYDTYHFERSDPESVNNGAIEVIIPERKQRNYGVQAGVSLDF